MGQGIPQDPLRLGQLALVTEHAGKDTRTDQGVVVAIAVQPAIHPARFAGSGFSLGEPFEIAKSQRQLTEAIGHFRMIARIECSSDFQRLSIERLRPSRVALELMDEPRQVHQASDLRQRRLGDRSTDVDGLAEKTLGTLHVAGLVQQRSELYSPDIDSVVGT